MNWNTLEYLDKLFMATAGMTGLISCLTCKPVTITTDLVSVSVLKIIQKRNKLRKINILAVVSLVKLKLCECQVLHTFFFS